MVMIFVNILTLGLLIVRLVVLSINWYQVESNTVSMTIIVITSSSSSTEALQWQQQEQNNNSFESSPPLVGQSWPPDNNNMFTGEILNCMYIN